MTYNQMLGITLVIFSIVLLAKVVTRFLQAWSEKSSMKPSSSVNG